MIRLSEEDLRLIKHLEITICNEIKRICNKYDIKYAISFGTLLGAIRHGGFIPWDDDIDIIMIRNEYDRFLLYAKDELRSQFEIVNYETNSNFGEPFTKVMLKNTVMLERFAEDAKAPCGVFVDIFPADVCPKNGVKRLFHRFKNYELRKRILIASNYNFRKTGLKKYVYALLGLTAKNKNKLVALYRKNETLYRNCESDEVVILGGNYGYVKDTLPRKWFNEYTTVYFEDEEFMTIKEFEEFLTHYYGDYMKLPPEDKRVNKHTVAKLDLSLFGGKE